MKLQFKFARSAGEHGRQHVIAELARRGAKAVRPLLPAERDEELANLFVAICEDDQAGRDMLEYLQRDAAVEFVEPEVRRKLIR